MFIMLHGKVLHDSMQVQIVNNFSGGTILPIQQQFLYILVILKFMFKSLSRSVECMHLWNFDSKTNP